MFWSFRGHPAARINCRLKLIIHDLPPKILYRYYFVFLSFFHGWWESPEEMNVIFIEWRKALGGKGLRD